MPMRRCEKVQKMRYKGKPSWQPGSACSSDCGSTEASCLRGFHKMHHHLLPKTEVRPSTSMATASLPSRTYQYTSCIYPIDYCCFRTRARRSASRLDVPLYNDNAKVLDQMNFQLNTENTNSTTWKFATSQTQQTRLRACAPDQRCWMHESPERRVLERLRSASRKQCHRVPPRLLWYVLRCDPRHRWRRAALHGMSYWAKGADEAGAERPTAEAESVSRHWRQQVAKLTTQLDKKYRQHDFQKVYDQCSAPWIEYFCCKRFIKSKVYFFHQF